MYIIDTLILLYFCLLQALFAASFFKDYLRLLTKRKGIKIPDFFIKVFLIMLLKYIDVVHVEQAPISAGRVPDVNTCIYIILGEPRYFILSSERDEVKLKAVRVCSIIQ